MTTGRILIIILALTIFINSIVQIHIIKKQIEDNILRQKMIERLLFPIPTTTSGQLFSQ